MGPECVFGSATLCGNRYGDLNQDVILTRQLYTEEELSADHGKQQCLLAAVLDGHGLLGERVAAAAGKAIVDEVLKAHATSLPLCQLSHHEIHSNLAAAFQAGHAACMELYSHPPADAMYPRNPTQNVHFKLQHSNGYALYRACGKECREVADRLLECGTTCSLVLVQGDTCALANAGDSTAVLGSLDGDGVSARVLSTQHCGLNPEEAARIEAGFSSGARIAPADGYLSITDGPWTGYELSVTRALGHKHLAAHGVTPEPYTTSFQLMPQDCCLVIASDGVWDAMSPREVVNRVMEAVEDGRSAQEAAEQLVADAVAYAQGGPGGEADNTSAVVMLFS